MLADYDADGLPDVLRLEDHKLAWPETREKLTGELEQGTYRALPARIIEVPKTELMVRPIAQLHPRDRVVYQAAVMELAPLIEEALTPAVFSARLDRTRGRLSDQRASWTRMQREGRRLHVDEGYGFLLSTDVVSYFEYVDLEILGRDLRRLEGADPDVLRLVSQLLNDVQRSSDVWGLPQGPEVSAILGNFYLQPIDRVLGLHPVVALRFQDDIKVFARDAASLRRVLRDAIRVMRSRHLNVAVSKTRIFEGDEVLRHLEDTRKDAIAYGIKSDGIAAVLPQLRNLFDSAVSEDPINARDVRFSVYRLSKARDTHAIPWILDNLVRVPFLAPLLARYLSAHLAEYPGIEGRTREFLTDETKNLYPWVELHLIRMFARAPVLEEPTITLMWEMLRDSNRELFVREQAARSIGRHARTGDAALLRTEFASATDHALRRALLVAITEADGTPDKSFLSTVHSGDPDLRSTAAFLRSGAVIPDP